MFLYQLINGITWNHRGTLFISSSVQKKTFFLIIPRCLHVNNTCFSCHYVVYRLISLPKQTDIRLCVLKTKVKWNKLKTLTVVSGFDLIFHAREDSGWHPAVTKHRRWYCLEFILKELFSAVSCYWQQMTRTKPVLKNVLAHHSLPYLICASKPDILHLHSSSQPLY